MRITKLEKIGRKVLLVIAPVLLAFAPVPQATAAYSDTVNAFGPVGYWRLNEAAALPSMIASGTATNYSSLGSAVDGTYFTSPTLGMPQSRVTGDTSVYFNPPGTVVGEFVEVPNTPALLTNSTMSFELWCLRTNLPGTGCLFSGGFNSANAGNAQTGFVLFRDNATAAGTPITYFLRVRNALGGDNANPVGSLQYNTRIWAGPEINTNLTLGTWDHLVYTWDTNSVKGYVNGVAITNQAFPAGAWYTPNTTDPIRIGVDSKVVPGTLTKEAWLAHAAIYPYELTPAQVAAHYGATTSASAYKATILGDNPVAYWPLNEAGPLPPKTYPTPVTCINQGSWFSGADGVLTPSGSLVNGFNTGAPGVPYAPFAGATSARFTGTGDRIVVPPQSLITNQFTIIAWHKVDQTPLANSMLFNSLSPNGADATGLGFTSAGSELGVLLNGPGQTPSPMTPSISMPANQWTFLAMVASPTETVLYVSSLYGLSSTTNTTEKLSSPHDFSLTNLFVGDGIQGFLSDVALFDRALTPAEIDLIYAAAEVPTPTTLQITAPNANGDFTVSGVALPGQEVKLWRSADLSLGQAGWTQIDAAFADFTTGVYSFALNQGVDTQAFYRVK